ncbi:hypothetical protein L561_3305 [Bordetella pertussis STO1-CHOC-0019]|nr:hypothetical protein L561_3305 [Bordetella pertussis STO1-CHOC-0019]
MAIDDHARVAFTDIHPDERFPSAVQFLKDAVAAWPSPTSPPTSASPAPSSSSRTQWPTTSAWA